MCAKTLRPTCKGCGEYVEPAEIWRNFHAGHPFNGHTKCIGKDGIKSDDYRLSALEAYRAGYAAGYFWGRIDEARGNPYDTRTPLYRFQNEGGANMSYRNRGIVVCCDCGAVIENGRMMDVGDAADTSLAFCAECDGWKHWLPDENGQSAALPSGAL